MLKAHNSHRADLQEQEQAVMVLQQGVTPGTGASRSPVADMASSSQDMAAEPVQDRLMAAGPVRDRRMAAHLLSHPVTVDLQVDHQVVEVTGPGPPVRVTGRRAADLALVTPARHVVDRKADEEEESLPHKAAGTKRTRLR